MDEEKKFHVLIGGFVVVAILLMGVMVIFGMFGLWRRHNKQNSARSVRENGDAAAADPWEAAGKRLNVDDQKTEKDEK